MRDFDWLERGQGFREIPAPLRAGIMGGFGWLERGQGFRVGILETLAPEWAGNQLRFSPA